MKVQNKDSKQNILKFSENELNNIKNNEKTIENLKEDYYDDISKIAKAIKRIKVSEKEKNIEKKENIEDMIIKEEENKNSKLNINDLNNFGILSNIKGLNLDSSPNNKTKDGTPTPSSLQEYRFNLIKMMDDDSRRNYQSKSTFLNNIHTPSSKNENETNFSFFLKNNLNNYNDNSLKFETPKNENQKLTIPNEFFENEDNINTLNHVEQGINNLNSLDGNIFIDESNNDINYNNNTKNYNGVYDSLNIDNINQINQNNNFAQYISQNQNQYNFLNNNNNNNLISNFQNQQNYYAYQNIYNTNNYLLNPKNNPIINVNINTGTNNCNNNSNSNSINSNNNYQQNNYINLNNNLNGINYPQLFNVGYLNNNKGVNKKKGKMTLKMNVNNMSLGELIKNSDVICKDQAGCRLLQKKIDEQPEIAMKILSVCFEKIIEIITDPFGNYLVQKLYEYMTEEKFLQLIALIKFDIYHICINSFGTRAIQKLIDYLNTETLMKNFLNLIKSIVKGITVDINGSHILLKMVDLKNNLVNKCIFEEIKDNILYIAMHKHGCCVLQKCIEKANSEDKDKEKLIESLINNCEILISDQCGNYIIQFIISLKNDKVNEKVVSILIGNLEEYSKQKFSSNVVEKIFECCSLRICQKLIDVLKYNDKMILGILFDKFGNYVLQKALQRADESTRYHILGIIAPHLYKLKNYSFGLKLYSKLIITYSYLGTAILTKNENQDFNKNPFNNLYYSNNNYGKNEINYNNSINNYNNIDMNLYFNP